MQFMMPEKALPADAEVAVLLGLHQVHSGSFKLVVSAANYHFAGTICSNIPCYSLPCLVLCLDCLFAVSVPSPTSGSCVRVCESRQRMVVFAAFLN